MKENVCTHIRLLRKEKGLSLKDLSERTGLSQSFISQVERGKCDMTLMSMVRIAKALNVEWKEFFEVENNGAIKEIKDENIANTSASIKMPDEIKTQEKRGNNHHRYYKKISNDLKERKFDVVLVNCEPHSDTEHMSHEGEDFIYVLEGAAHITIGDELTIVRQGESIHFPSTVPHSMCNKQDVMLTYIVVVSELID